jgi:phospholipid transport system substrate-binding protein
MGQRNGTNFMTQSISRRAALLGAVSILMASQAGTAAAAKSPEDFVKRLTDQVISLANGGQKGKALRGRFASLLERNVNLRNIANFALGPYQKKMSAKEKSTFYSLVSNYAAALFVYYADDFKGEGLEIIDTSTQGNFTTIKSAIVRGAARENVRWRLINSGGTYRVSDVNIKGVWMTISMKKRFTDILNRSKGDFEPLFAELREAESW